MGDVPKNSNGGSLTGGHQLETIVPSKIRTFNRDGSRSSVASTLKGSLSKTLSVVDHESPPTGWTRIKHPDSGVYYVNEERSLCTASDVLNPRIYSLINRGAEMLQMSPTWQALSENQRVVVLDVFTKDRTQMSYYCVSHAERRVFWLEDVSQKEVPVPCPSNKCTQTSGSMLHCVEAQYWRHCELFPTTLNVTKRVTRELKHILLQAAADRLLVKFSTSPYDKNALESMLQVVKEIEEDSNRPGNGHAAWIVARFMGLYNDGLLQSSYGQADDYFDIEDTGPKIGPYQRPLLLTILGPLFLRSPDVYAVELYSFHEAFSLARWSSFVHKVDQSIRDSNLLATVLLTTNMGFLAWNDSGRKGGINSPTPVQIVAYISIICSVGSIIIGLAIFKQYRAKGADTPLRAVVVLRRILKEPFGLERLAIICSLPYVLLMWGLISFLAAFSIVFYQDTGIQVRIPITIGLFFVVLSLFFCMYTAGPPDKEDQKPKRQSDHEKVISSASSNV